MKRTLRAHILLTLAPLLVLLLLLGGAGLLLLHRLGGLSDAILRENYDSVRAMEQLAEAAERIDSSFQFALAGKEAEARAAFDANWQVFENQFHIEETNITIFPDEPRLVNELRALKVAYREAGDRFFRERGRRHEAYFGPDGKSGLLGQFRNIKRVADEILRINHDNMLEAARDAKTMARWSLVGLGAGVALASLLAVWLGWRTARAVLRPIEEMTRAARAIGEGQLNRSVPVFGPDELGQLGEAFNTMTRHLRELRETNAARLLRAQKTSQATIDSFADPVLVVGPEGRVELANPAARRLLGVTPEAEWVPPEPLREPLADALRSRRPYLTDSFDQSVTFQADGGERAYLPQVRPINDAEGGVLGAAVVLDDVTRFRLLDRVKGDLVATVSHELKTPLTGIRLAVHILLEEVIGPLTPKQMELLLDARDNCERLLKMIESLLTMARLERGTGLNKVPHLPAALLRAAADTAAGRAADRHVTLSVEVGDDVPLVEVDAGRFGQALNNLVDNALTHTEAGGRVTLSASRADDGQVELTVADTGVGIPPESLPHVFTRFFRVQGRDDPPGTGLGLTIVREVVTAHGGTITCESEPGRGTTFRIRLPEGVEG